jgi:hypothetical protein
VKFQNLSIDLQLQLTVTRTVHKLYSNSPWELGREESNLAMASQRGIAGTSALDAAIALRERPSRRDEGQRPRSGRPPPRGGRRLPATPAPLTNPLLPILSVFEQIEGQRTQV